jgi:predicted phage terminase large subunit-like protein
MRRTRNPVYGSSRTVGSNPTLSAKDVFARVRRPLQNPLEAPKNLVPAIADVCPWLSQPADSGGTFGGISTDRVTLIRNTATRDGRPLKQSLPQDLGQAGKSQLLAFAKLLAGHNMHTSPEFGDKVTRATPFASQMNAGNVDMVRAPWNQEFTDELKMFPNGRYDDQADGAARAFNGLLHPAACIF